jgi:hypothetical protein
VGYLPLATLKPLAPGLWIVDDIIVVSGLHLPIRMTVIRLGNGHLILHSPTLLTTDLANALDKIGTVRHLLGPTFAHWARLAEWQRAYPTARTWAVPGLRDRAQVRNAGVRIDEDLGRSAPEAWSLKIKQGIVPGRLGFSEVYFYHRMSRTLILCDLIENLESSRLAPISRLLAWAARGTSGTTAIHVRALLRLRGNAVRDVVRDMIALQPARLIFAHGAIFDVDAADRLRQAFAWLVGRP